MIRDLHSSTFGNQSIPLRPPLPSYSRKALDHVVTDGGLVAEELGSQFICSVSLLGNRYCESEIAQNMPDIGIETHGNQVW